MTIVAYKDGVMAADKQTTSANMGMTVTKIRRLHGGSLAGASGNASMCRRLIQWVDAGGDPKDYPDGKHECIVLVVRPGGHIHLFDEGPTPIDIEDSYVAIGSGRDFAMAAMYMGASAEEAVAVASHFENNCGRGIDTLSLRDAAPA